MKIKDIRGRLYPYRDEVTKKYGFRSSYNATVIKPVFDDIVDFISGFYCVRSKDRFGYVGRDGLFFPPRYDRGDDFRKGHVYWVLRNGHGHLFRNGRFVSNHCAEKAVNGVFVVNRTANENLHHTVANLCGEIVFDFSKAEYEPQLKDDGGYTRIVMWDSHYYYNGWYIEPDGMITVSKFDGSKKLYHARVKQEYCYIDNNRNIVFNADMYEASYEYSSGLARADKDGKTGFLDEFGRVAIPFLFNDCDDFIGERAVAYFENSEVKFDGKNGIRFSEFYLDRFPRWFKEMFLRFARNLSRDIETGEYVIAVPDRQDKVDFRNAMANCIALTPAPSLLSGEADGTPNNPQTVLENGSEDDLTGDSSGWEVPWYELTKLIFKRLQGLIDLKGNIVCPPTLYPGSILDDKPMPVPMLFDKGKVKYGYMDKNWNTIIEPVFDSAYLFEENLAKVIIDGKEGLIGLDGTFILEPIYDYISLPAIHRAERMIYLVRQNQKEYLVTSNGEPVLASPYGVLVEITPDIFMFTDFSTYSGLINIDGKIILPLGEYLDMERFGQDKVLIRTNSCLCGMADRNGIIAEPKYCSIDSLLKDIPDVRLKDQNNSSDKDGIGRAETASFIPFCHQGLWGYKNHEGDVVIPPLLDDIVTNFHNRYAWVVYLGNMYRMDQQGLLYQENECAGQLWSPLPKEVDGVWGYVNSAGAFVIQPIYDKAGYFNHDFAEVSMNGWTMRIDFEGRMIEASRQ